MCAVSHTNKVFPLKWEHWIFAVVLCIVHHVSLLRCTNIRGNCIENLLHKKLFAKIVAQTQRGYSSYLCLSYADGFSVFFRTWKSNSADTQSSPIMCLANVHFHRFVNVWVETHWDADKTTNASTRSIFFSSQTYVWPGLSLSDALQANHINEQPSSHMINSEMMVNCACVVSAWIKSATSSHPFYTLQMPNTNT